MATDAQIESAYSVATLLSFHENISLVNFLTSEASKLRVP